MEPDNVPASSPRLHALSQSLVDLECDCRKFENENHRNYLVACPRRGCVFLAEGHEGCFRFTKLPELFMTPAGYPGAPQGPFGVRRVRRNFANSPGVPQVPFWSFGVLLTHYFDRGSPQVALGPFGASRLSFGNLLIQCVNLRAPQVPSGPLGIFIAFAFDPRATQVSFGPLEPFEPYLQIGPGGSPWDPWDPCRPCISRDIFDFQPEGSFGTPWEPWQSSWKSFDSLF